MAKKKGTNTVTMLIMLLLIAGLAGFGVTNFGGSLNSVATVGDAEVTTSDYARAVEARMRDYQRQTGQQMTFQQARLLGVDRVALSQLITEATLENEAGQAGISVGDENVSREIVEAPAFQSGTGGFDREVYELTLRQNGVSVSDFENRVRRDLSVGLLRNAVQSGVRTPDIFVDTLYDYARETRDVTWARLTADDLTAPIPEPTEADLAAFHEANAEAFTRPETKVIEYAWLVPDMIVDTIEVEESQVRALYDARIDEYRQPERRLVERLVFASEADAEAARARLDAGDATFDDLVQERGLSLSDVDLGDVSVSDLGEASELVFGLDEPGVVGPAPSGLGPALFRMNGILAAQETSFEEARPELAAEAASDRARRIISDVIPQIEDLLAAGADMSVLAERTDMEQGSIEWNVEVFEDIAAYDAFRSAAATTATGDFPRVIELDDGGIVALTVTEVIAPELRPLDEVRADVADAWAQAETEIALKARAEALAEEISGGREMAALDLNLQMDRGVTRDGFIEGTPPEFTETAFSLDVDELSVLSADGDAWLVRLDAVNSADGETTEAELIKAQFTAQASQELSQALIAAYTQALLNTTGVEINEAAINAVNAQLP